MNQTARFAFTLFLVILCTSCFAQTLTLSVNKIVDPDVPVKVSWKSAIPEFDTGDALIFYLIPNDSAPSLPIPDTFPKKHIIGFYKVAELAKKIGYDGAVDIEVVLPRDYSYYFEYRRLKVEPPVTQLLAYSALLPDANVNTCSQFHLAFTHNSTNLQLAYTTSQPPSVVQYVHISGNKSNIDLDVWGDKVFKNSTQNAFVPSIDHGTYTIDEMFSKPANTTEFFINPGRFREAVISTPPLTNIYYYRIRDAAGKAISKAKFLFTPIQPTPQFNGKHFQQFDTDVFAFGDSGIGFDFHTVFDVQAYARQTYLSISRVIKARQDRGDMTPTHIVHNGDLIYSRGIMVLQEYFFKQIEPLASAYPWMIELGNHEMCIEDPNAFCRGGDSGGENGIPFYRRFKMPEDFQYYPYTDKSMVVDDQTQMYAKNNQRNIAYSYNAGSIHFIVFTVELDYKENSAQIKFIEKDLQSVDRTLYPWVILLAHRPIYCTTEECQLPSQQQDKITNDTKLRALVQPLMVKYNVSIGLWGHEHQYERFKLMREDFTPVETCDDHLTPTSFVLDGVEHIYSVAPLNILSGIAGNHFNMKWAPYSPTIHHDPSIGMYHHQTPPYVAFRQMGTFGYSHFRANATHLIGKFYSTNDVVHDQFVLIKP